MTRNGTFRPAEPRPRIRRVQKTGERGNQHQRNYRDEILNDQPTHGEPAALRVEEAAVLQRAQQHDRARDRQGKTENQRCAEGKADEAGDGRAETGGNRDLHHDGRD
jgi:hypothetical protein